MHKQLLDYFAAEKQGGVAWAVGMGLVLQASAMFVFDLLAVRRGAAYLRAVLRL